MSGAGRFLSRWSRLKRAPVAAEPVADTPLAVQASVHAQTDEAVRAPPDLAPELPDVASLALDSDFTAFLKAEVGEGLRRQALKKLFSDPHFNVMDGLDIYIDDYSVSTPIPPEILEKLRSAAEWLAEDEAEEGRDARAVSLAPAAEKADDGSAPSGATAGCEGDESGVRPETDGRSGVDDDTA